MQLRRHLALLVFVLLIAPTAWAQFRLPKDPFATPQTASNAPRAVTKAYLNVSALQPGQQAAIAVVTEIAPGFHAQSRTPTKTNYIAFELSTEPSEAIRFYDPIYPAGEDQTYPALGKLNVYSGRVVIYVPIEVKRDAKAGPITIKGKARYQICDDRTCFRPESPEWSVSTQIVGAGEKVEAANAEFFKGFDPSVFSRLAPRAGWAELLGKYIAAFFIGIIFNVMPCVLPVVPLKIVGFYEVSQHDRRRSVMLGAVFSAGIVATFALLAVLVLVLHKFEWGQLFGNLWFNIAIVVVLVILALQTFGAFEVVLPSAVYRYTPSHETVLGNFLFGIFTAILSTPCTFGLFLGLLIWAASQSALIGTTLLTVVGLGMASPYLVLSAFPQVARRLPRSGPWAAIVKQMMGFLLLAVAVYFGRRFLTDIVGRQGFWWVVFAVLAASGVFLVARTVQLTRRFGAIALAVVIALLIVGPALAVTIRLAYVPLDWVEYSPEALEKARAEGRPVVIDFTADWCGNCQALEATVFIDERVVAEFKARRVVAVRADLSKEHAPGWKLLTQLNPVGAIPLTAVYVPGRAEVVKLVGLYSTDDLLAALSTDLK